jgi:hypothetical protein
LTFQIDLRSLSVLNWFIGGSSWWEGRGKNEVSSLSQVENEVKLYSIKKDLMEIINPFAGKVD